MLLQLLWLYVIIVVHDVIVDNGALVGQVLVQVVELAVPFRYDPTSPWWWCCTVIIIMVVIIVIIVVNFTYSDVIHCIE